MPFFNLFIHSRTLNPKKKNENICSLSLGKSLVNFFSFVLLILSY